MDVTQHAGPRPVHAAVSSPLVLTADQVADACQVCTKTVYRAVAAGRLRAVRLGRGGAYRFRLDDVRDWIDGSAVAPRERRTPTRSAPPIPAPAKRRPAQGRAGTLVVREGMGRPGRQHSGARPGAETSGEDARREGDG
jgi:excisionase family DNA binding protein